MSIGKRSMFPLTFGCGLLGVLLAPVLAVVRPATATAATASGVLCTTAPSTAANVDTDCLNDGSTSFETTLAVNPTNPQNLVGAAISGQLTSQGGKPSFSATVRPRVSFDGGRSWSTIGLNFGPDSYAIDPSVAFDANGTVYLAAAASGGNGRLDIVVSHSADGGLTWSSPVRVAAASGSSGAGVSNDHPQLAAAGSGTVLLTWIRSFFGSGGTFLDSPVYDAVSQDGGDTWSAPASISGSAPFCVGAQANDACDLAYGNAMVMTSAGAVVAFQDTYQDAPDGSTNLGRNEHMVVTVDPLTGARTGGPYLVGQAYDGINEQDFPVDSRGLQTLQDSQLNLDLDGGLAVDPTDPSGRHLAVSWYDDRNAPHPVSSDPYQAVTNADIVVSQSFDGGQTWSTPTTISEANDQFMPAMVYDATGRLRVGFYDRSYDPANRAYGYTLATETGPRTLKFTTAKITTALSDPTEGTVGLGFTVNSAFPNPAFGIGDYTALALTPTSLDAYWTDMRRTVCENGQCGSTEDAFFASVPLQ